MYYFAAHPPSFILPENQCNVEESSQYAEYLPKYTDNHEESIDIDNILTDLFANREGACGQSSERNGDLTKSCEEADKENVNPRGVQNVMFGQPLDDERADLNYFYGLQWQGQYHNDPHISPEFGSFLEDANYTEEDQDELDSRGLLETLVEKSQEGVPSVIQFEPRLTSTTVLPPLSTSELPSNIQESRATTLPGEDEERTTIHEPNQPPSPPQPASPLPQMPTYELRSGQNRKSEQEDDVAINYLVGKSGGRGGRGRGRGRGRGGGRGQKRKHDVMTTSVPSPADSVTFVSVGSGGG